VPHVSVVEGRVARKMSTPPIVPDRSLDRKASRPLALSKKCVSFEALLACARTAPAWKVVFVVARVAMKMSLPVKAPVYAK